jgi:glycosyltransferase involved in cell wall biosynthesis
MQNKTAYLISCSDHYGHRLHAIDGYLRAWGYHTTYLTSDFDHTSKTPFTCHVPDCVQLPTRPYRKNLSLARILSHRSFARDAFRYLEALSEQPDLVVVLLPPNFLAHYAAKYRKKHPNVKLIFDIFDMWPETFPFGRLKILLKPVFSVWAWIRNHNLGAADLVTTECALFRRLLKLPEDRSAVVPLCAQPLPAQPAELREDTLDLCYLGAINNVISIPDICALIGQLIKSKPVTLHIIGKGERQQEFIDAATAAGANVEFYGAVYDEETKQSIMGKCHFGLNIMKSSVCVGLTMKSVDYFRFGLPILNNIPADTEELVNREGIGLQLNEQTPNTVLAMEQRDFLRMRSDVRRVFEMRFATSVIEKQYDSILYGLLTK